MLLHLIIAYLFNVLDYVFTAHWINKFGIEIEASMFGRWLFEHNLAWLYKIVVVGLAFSALSVLLKRRVELHWLAEAILIIYSLLFLWHIYLYINVYFLNN